MSLHLAQANCSPSLVMTTTTSGRCYVVSISTSFKFNPFHYLPHFPHFLFLDLFFAVPLCRLLPIYSSHHYWKYYHFLGKDPPRLHSVERWWRIFVFQFSSQAFVNPLPSPPMYTSSYPSQYPRSRSNDFLAHFILVSYQSFSILSSVPSFSHWEETYYSGISVINFKASVAGRWADTNLIRHCINVGGFSLRK